KIREAGVRRRAELYYQQFDALAALRQQARRELLAEAGKHSATELLRQIPSIGPIRAALLIALMQTPHRFRSKSQLWAYCGLALKTYTSGEYRFVDSQLKRSKKVLAIRGLNKNHNHDLKNIFKGTATRAAATAGPFQDFYEACVARGIKPAMARLTLARKIAAITLSVCGESIPNSSRMMTGCSSRRSGSRVSIHNAVRLRVLWAPSLSRNPMLPRTTRKSDRRKVSDRTMVGFAQPLCLSASGTDGRRYESTMNLRKRENHRVSFHYWGWTARPFPLCLTVVGEAFVLTFPFIERRYRNVARTVGRTSQTACSPWTHHMPFPALPRV